MLDNDKFLIEWKPKHEKGPFLYVVTNILFLLISLALITLVLILIYQPTNPNNIRFVIINNIIILLITTIAKVLEWVKGEKKYKEIMRDQ